MTFPPTKKTFEGLLDQTLTRLTLVERRLAVSQTIPEPTPPYVLPDRLGPTGLKVTDWNTAKEVGFYWGTTAANQPPGTANWWVGTVQTLNNGARVLQTVYQPDNVDAPRFQRFFRSDTSVWSAWEPIGTTDELPADEYAQGPSTTTLTGGAGSWQVMSGAVVSITPRMSLWVDVVGNAVVKASAGNVAIGVNVTGGLTLGPGEPPGGGANSTHFTAFTASTVDDGLSLVPKRLLIPGGVATTFTFWANRSNGTATATCNYPLVQVLPVRWA